MGNPLGWVNLPAQVFRLPLEIKQHACHVTQSNRLKFTISGLNDELPENFCESDLAQKAITELIHRLESRISSQNEIDKAYDDLCVIYYSQNECIFRSNDVYPCSRKRLHRSIKPFLSDELQSLWKNICTAELVHCNLQQEHTLPSFSY